VSEREKEGWPARERYRERERARERVKREKVAELNDSAPGSCVKKEEGYGCVHLYVCERDIERDHACV